MMLISFLGSGNVATHLAKALHESGYQIIDIWSKTPQNAQLLANMVGAKVIEHPSLISPSAEIIIVCVSDNAVKDVISSLQLKNQILVHTAGTLPMSILENNAENIGVLYPLQTFSKQVSVNFSTIPMALEANNQSTLETIKSLSLSLSEHIYEVSSQKRKLLHISAVFACNFTNHFYAIADELLSKNDLDFTMLKPLIEATTQKIRQHKPKEVQTGPARRNDTNVMQEHIAMLSQYPDWVKIYEAISNDIVKMYSLKLP